MSSTGNCRLWFLGSMPVWMFGVFTLPVFVGICTLFSSHKFPLGVSLWLIVLPLIAMTDRECEVDGLSARIVTRWKLYRVIQLWRTDMAITDYEAITCRRSGGKGVYLHEQEWVALVRPSAKFTYVIFCNARKKEFCQQAWSVALMLSEATGLPIQEYPDRLFNRKAPARNV